MSVTTFAAAQILRVIPRRKLSRAVGRLCERPLPGRVSRAVAAAYARAYGVDLDEAAPESGPYPTFDAFFTRRLKDGARPIDDDVLVSPADGSIESVGPVDHGSRIFVKGRPYDVGELIGDAADAGRYNGGGHAVVYLSPRDYHRVHSPVDGQVTAVRWIAGDLFPVNSIGEQHVADLFVKNQRAAILIDTPDLGRVTAVMIGAVIVGRITVTALGDRPPTPGRSPVDPPRAVSRGDEIGIFHLGSTVVLMVEPKARISRGTGQVRYGQSLIRAS